jgi:hypothetical protein
MSRELYCVSMPFHSWGEQIERCHQQVDRDLHHDKPLFASAIVFLSYKQFKTIAPISCRVRCCQANAPFSIVSISTDTTLFKRLTNTF